MHLSTQTCSNNYCAGKEEWSRFTCVIKLSSDYNNEYRLLAEVNLSLPLAGYMTIAKVKKWRERWVGWSERIAEWHQYKLPSHFHCNNDNKKKNKLKAVLGVGSYICIPTSSLIYSSMIISSKSISSWRKLRTLSKDKH